MQDGTKKRVETHVETSPGGDDTINMPGDNIVAASREAARDIVNKCREIGPRGFVRLNNIIRAALVERIKSAETDFARHMSFERGEQAAGSLNFIKFYNAVFSISDLFVAAASDEAGLDMLGVAFGGAAAGHVHVGGDEFAALLEASGKQIKYPGVMKEIVELHNAVDRLKNSARDCEGDPLYPAQSIRGEAAMNELRLLRADHKPGNFEAKFPALASIIQ